MTRKTLGALALCIGSVIIFALPAGSFGAGDLRSAREALVQAGQQLQAGLESTVQKTGEKTAALVEKTKARLKKATDQDSKTRATATDPPIQPPTHGTNPHGQGTIAVVDINPSTDRPLAADPDGGDSGEDVVVGRARGERNADGTYHGHISAVGLFGNDVIPVDTVGGETKDGPLQSLQANILDPLCTNTNQQVCLTVLRMHSETTGTSSTNDFAVARAGLLGLGVGAADSQGVAGQAGACQSSGGAANTANVATSTGTDRAGREVVEHVEVLQGRRPCGHAELRGHRPRRHRRPAAGRRLRERHPRHAGRSTGPAADHLQCRGAGG